jgi:hypothetical protein
VLSGSRGLDLRHGPALLGGVALAYNFGRVVVFFHALVSAG